jgi:DNA invertase Pin-like site-specific DNA recombinase
MMIGYARVSTDDQNLALQLDALRAAGCELVHEDKASGVLNGRKGLSEALKGCASGDVLVVWKLDRLARSLHDLVVIAADLKGRGVGLKILTGEGAAVDTTHPQGRMIFGILAVMAEFERELMSHRGRDGGGEAPGPSCREAAQGDASQTRPCQAVDRGRHGKPRRGGGAARRPRQDIRATSR